ncbi:MAG: hypothetical protein ACI4VX_02035 [Succinivibrionaceae bacterium]
MDPLSGISSSQDAMQLIAVALNKKSQIGDGQMSLELLESAVNTSQQVSANMASPGANPSDRLGTFVNVQA